MRSIIGLYLAIGVALLAIGFLFTGPCLSRNTDIVRDVVFVLTWPVGLYAEVYRGDLSVEGWLHAQACGAADGSGAGKIPS
jgi:hypothetical protein